MPIGYPYNIGEVEMMTILAMVRQYPIPPSITQIQKAIGAKSTNTAFRRVQWLIAEGYLERVGPSYLNLKPTQKGLDTYPEYLVMVDGKIPMKPPGKQNQNATAGEIPERTSEAQLPGVILPEGG